MWKVISEEIYHLLSLWSLPDIFQPSLFRIGIIFPQGFSEIWHQNTKKLFQSHSRPKQLYHLSQRIQCMMRHTIMPAQYHGSGSPQRYSLWLLFWFDVEFIFYFNVNCPWISVLLFYNDFYFDHAMISTLFYFQLFFFLCFTVMFHFTFSFELFFLLFFIQS